jgi:uncharacterized membrane protein YphA (DoxX/SURF4 family)
MSMSAKLRRAPLRAVTGAYILNSGVGKLSADDDTAKAVHGMASGTYPFLGKVQPKMFVRGLAVGEIAIGGALLLPIVSPVVAGAALVGFSGALLNVYWNTPGMHEEGSPRPTSQGIGMSKDVWMVGAGVGLLADALLEPAHDKKVEVGAAVAARRGRKARKARKAAKGAAKSHEAAALAAAQGAAHAAAGWLASARDEYGPVAADKAKQAREGARHIAEEYGPVAADKAKSGAQQARKSVRDFADEYGPVAADKANKARQAAREVAEEYGPAAAEKARTSARKARKAARGLADEYGPVAAEKTKKARKAARGLADEYGPLAAEKAKQAAEKAAQARQAARDLADEYGPIAAEKAKQAREAAEAAAARLQASVR